MTTIKDILKIDLQEDIKNVIDLEDRSENEIQSEIESYIVTEGLGKHLSNFTTRYTGNIKETGVWLSGFYGSGKSYFGKMLGYIIDNPTINGTSARDRFIPRLKGVSNESLLENDIRKLDSIRSKVVFLDVAKQNTDNGLAFTLFSNFIKSLDFRDDLYGYMEYDLFLSDDLMIFKEKAKTLLGKEWEEIRKSNREVARAFRRVSLTMDYSEKEYEDTKKVYENSIGNFSASKFKDELEKYLNKYPEETLVFIFDEASEAVSQKKFDLLELEGISEALSSISHKVWTIAIAQEKLDDVINNANVNKSMLTKVTDRFKTKIHLESTEVDVIIRNRLLQKNEADFQDLLAYFKENDGLVSDATNLKSSFPTKTTSAEQFATYYPFHKYQFDLLQKFLFSSNSLVASQIAARGMIITTFDVLRKGLKDQSLFGFVTAHNLCSEAQTSPPADLVNKYSNAASILKHQGSTIDGEKLLKVIHFLGEAELVSTNLENITKSYIADIASYYTVKPEIEKMLALLVEAKILLYANNNYKITSDLEGKLLEEMKDFDVDLFIKKRDLVNYLKKMSIFRQVSTITDDGLPFAFNIQTDLGDEIVGAKNDNLKFMAYSLFNINEDRQDFVETLKLDTQFTKDLITLVPDNSRFPEIDRLMEEVKQYGYMEEKYKNDEDSKKREIIREFITIKEEKEKDLISLIESAYLNGSLIYLFDENLLDANSFKPSINEVQRKLIRNIYTKRLRTQLSEGVAPKILQAQNPEKLHGFFSGEDYKFFDANGNFTGETLKVVEEITAKINNKYIDGRSLEEELAIPPWGYAYGTLVTTLAVLFRAGRLFVKFNDTEYTSHSNKASHEAFSTGRKFQNARYKSITKTLSSAQKNQAVQALLDLDFKEHTGNKIDWNVSDFELADCIRHLAEHFISSLNALKNSQPDFEKLFSLVVAQKEVLQNYSGKVTESNYLDKTEAFLKTKVEFSKALKTILKAEKFIKKNLDKLKGYQRFVDAVSAEFSKAGIQNAVVTDKTEEFNRLFSQDIVAGFADLQDAAQAIKDEYFQLMNTHAKIMTQAHQDLLPQIAAAQKELENCPDGLNPGTAYKLTSLRDYTQARIVGAIKMKYHAQCQNCHFSLADILNYIALAPNKQTELDMIRAGFVKQVQAPVVPGTPKAPKKLKLTVTKKVMKTSEYKNLLSLQLQAMAGMDNDDEVEVTIDNQAI